jgi:hypothetical protein
MLEGMLLLTVLLREPDAATRGPSPAQPSTLPPPRERTIAIRRLRRRVDALRTAA